MNWAPVHLPRRELLEVYAAPVRGGDPRGRAGVDHERLQRDRRHAAAARRQELLADLLRGELGFDGVVVTDYFTVATLHQYHRIAADEGEAARLALEAGLDVELPALHCYGEPLRAGDRSGQRRRRAGRPRRAPRCCA